MSQNIHRTYTHTHGLPGEYQWYSADSQYPNQYGIGKNKASGKATTANGGRGLNVLTANG